MEITGELSESHFKKFVATIYYLIEEQHIQFDLIIGSGNTGILSAKFTELVYKKLGKEIPSILQIPALRYQGPEKPENLFDNSILYPDVANALKQQNVFKLENVLFVDDEIYGGNALKAVMKLLVEYKNKNGIRENTTCYIVAEDQGVSSEFLIPDIQTKFYPFEIGVDGTSNVITYFLPLELENPVTEALGDKIGSHTVINILLGLPIRDKKEDITKPEFSYQYNELASQKIENFSALQNQAYIIVTNLLEKGIEEYKSNLIRLPFQSSQ